MDKEAEEKLADIIYSYEDMATRTDVWRKHCAWEIVKLLDDMGYRKLPKDKPPLIHADGCATNLGIIGAMCNCGAETQREVCIEHYEG